MSNSFKKSFRLSRNDNKIYKGFGKRHLDDVTNIYVDPRNQAYPNKTSLSQSISEAVIFLADYIDYIKINQKYGKIYISENEIDGYIKIFSDWHFERIIDTEIEKFTFYYSNITKSMEIGFLDTFGEYISDESIIDSYMRNFLENLCHIIFEYHTNAEYRELFDEFVFSRNIENFVKLEEIIYQNNKNNDYNYQQLYENSVKNEVEFSDNTFELLYFGIQDIEKENEVELEEELSVIIKYDNKEFNEEYLELVPNLPEEFIIPKKLRKTCNAISSGDSISMLLTGPAGTGKTMSAKLIAQNINMPLMEVINCSENLDEFILGKYIPKDDKIIFYETYVTKAIRYGGMVVFEEINFAKPQYLAFLNSLLDDNGFVRLDNGEVVRRHKNFRFLATMNRGYYGTKELNQALYNRFNIIVEMDELSKEDIRRMLIKRVPECEPKVDKVITVYNKILKRIKKDELDFVISARNLENWVRLAKYEGYVDAAEKTIIPIAKGDEYFEKTIRSSIKIFDWK